MGKAPTWRAGANLGKAMAGAGILAQPSVAHALGLGWWFVAWTAAMGISGYTMYLVSRSKISADEIAGPAPHTLSELTNKITKNARCARAVEALVCVLQMSFGVGYVVVMLSLVCRALVPSLARWAACLALAPLAGCLALIPDLNRLTLVSVFGLFVTVVGVVGLSGGYALTSDAFEVHLWGSAGPGTPSCSWGVLIRHVGSILYSVESVNHVMPNADMMADPTRLPRVIAIVMVSYWLFVGAWVALTDMAGFGKCPGGGAIVIDCLPAGPPRDVLKVAVCLQLLASLPITMFPAVEMLERRAVPVADDDDGKPDHSLNAPLLDREPSADLTDTTRPSYVSTVSASTVFTGLVGCLFLSLLGFILPVVLFETSASGHRGENAPLRSLAHVLIAVLGVILAIVGTGTSIVALRGGVSK
ncbi:hypothetical protein JL720_8613 [Aureococcus anophagefferens]|nr:hypothetical protein JL720_8613 [Aureococcus anophagefferens]